MPPGAEECDQSDINGGACGVPGLIAMVQASKGSVANVRAVQNNRVNSGLAQADVVYRAYHGEGVFEAEGQLGKLRAIANLYPETVHLVARKGSHIKKIHHLAGKRVSLGQVGSGTRADAELLLNAHGIKQGDFEDYNLSLSQASEKLLAGELDAFFLVGGYPIGAISDLARRDAIELVPIDSPEIDNLMQTVRFFSRDGIPARTYDNLIDIKTVSVGALWVTSIDQPIEKIYDLTKALWAPSNRAVLANGHEKGKLITLDTALEGVPILLHPGAEKFYFESGMLAD